MSYYYKKENATILTSSLSGGFCPSDLKDLIENSLQGDKAFDIDVIDLQDQLALADYMIVASGTSSRQVTALAQKLKTRLEARGLKALHMEGLEQGNWVIVDAGDVIVHIFRPEVRDFYKIEKMWKMPLQGQENVTAHQSL